MRIAVLGVGRMGKNVIRHLKEYPEPVDLIAYDCDPAAVRCAMDEFAIHGTASLDEILADESIRLVFIASSNASHKGLAIAAMCAGKAVMCEKPMATRAEDAVAMVEAAGKFGAFLQIGFELRYSKLYQTVKRWIDEGRLGEIRNIQCNYICSEFWGKNSWRTRLESGGSLFGEKLSHYVDLPRWWVDKPVRTVHAAASPNIIPYFQVRDNYHATCTFEGGAVSHLTFMMPFASNAKGDPLTDPFDQQKDDGHELRFLIMGTKGGVETNVFQRHVRRWEYGMNDEGFQSNLVEQLTWSRPEDHEYFHNTRDQTHDIVSRVARGLPPGTSARDSLATMEVCAAVDASLDRGTPVVL